MLGFRTVPAQFYLLPVPTEGCCEVPLVTEGDVPLVTEGGCEPLLVTAAGFELPSTEGFGEGAGAPPYTANA